MKIKIATINGGGGQTLMRLADSLEKNVFPALREMKGVSWTWTVLSQGPFGSPPQLLQQLKEKYGQQFTGLIYPRNLGTPWSSNELIDWAKKSDFDIFWMIDDDIEMTDPQISQLLIDGIKAGYKTSCTAECFYGADFQSKRHNVGPREIVEDHGSGCTMYHKSVFAKVGYHDEELIQYAHDSEFNKRIKLAFGDQCLSMTPGQYCNHFAQTGTKVNFQAAYPFGMVVGHDQAYMAKWNCKSPMLQRKVFKKPLFTQHLVKVI